MEIETMMQSIRDVFELATMGVAALLLLVAGALFYLVLQPWFWLVVVALVLIPKL